MSGARVLWTVAYAAGMVLIFAGERFVPRFHASRWILDASGLGILVLTPFLRALIGRHDPAGLRAYERRIRAAYLAGLVAIVAYTLQADPLFGFLRLRYGWGDWAGRARTMAQVGWPIVLTCALVPLLFMETSFRSMARGAQLDARRIAFSARSGLTVALAACLLFVLNYLTSEWNVKRDLSFLRSTNPSEETMRRVGALSQDVEVSLFYPNVNEVKEDLLSYFEPLRDASGRFRLTSFDHVAEPKLSRDLGVTANGYVVVKGGSRNEKLFIGLEIEEAKRKLKSLDADFLKALIKVSREAQTIYLTAGHGEADTYATGEGAPAPVRALREFLAGRNATVKRLGMAEGLGADVPQDAAAVIAVGPRQAFIKEEVSALHRYVTRGGRLVLLLDPEPGVNHEELLTPYGVRLHPVNLANDQYYVRRYAGTRDRGVLFSNRFSSHASVSTLSRHSTQMAVVFEGLGWIEKIEGGGEKKPDVQVTVRSMPETWADENGNFEFDSKSESRKVYDVGAAVTVKPTSEAKTPEGRILLLADSFAVSDEALGNLGNLYWLADAVKWLLGEEELAGVPTPPEDVRISHTKSEDVAWFYSTIAGVPLLLLAVGYIHLRRLRKGRRA
ncbi:MAG: Gldg family protein [Nitrospirae bacterium]|nr:Gldg family protein [Nitrospirota bacterium]